MTHVVNAAASSSDAKRSGVCLLSLWLALLLLIWHRIRITAAAEAILRYSVCIPRCILLSCMYTVYHGNFRKRVLNFAHTPWRRWRVVYSTNIAAAKEKNNTSRFITTTTKLTNEIVELKMERQKQPVHPGGKSLPVNMAVMRVRRAIARIIFCTNFTII